MAAAISHSPQAEPLDERAAHNQEITTTLDQLNNQPDRAGFDSEQISDYASWQHTVSEHQARIQQYLGLRPFDLDESNALERFAFEESCRLEQTALLLARAQEFLKERRLWRFHHGVNGTVLAIG